MSDLPADSTDDDAGENLDPELDIEPEDIPDALPHGRNPHPPSESDAPIPG